MRSISSFEHIYLCRSPIDMRKQIPGLSVLVEGEMELDLFKKYLFVFCNKKRSHLKILYWDLTGFALWLKVLDKDKFKWPIHLDGENIELTRKELRWLLRGYDLSKIKAHKKLSYKKVL